MGVRRLRQLLEEQYGACFPLGPVGSDVALVLDGNNFALWLAKKTVNETRHAGYGALDAAVRDVVEMYRRGAPERRIVAVFDGAATAAERLARAATLEARAHQRGDVASAAAYEGGSVVGGLALEQVAFTLSALGVDVRRARGEADAAIAWLCASCAGSALAVTDDTDLALYRGVRVLRLSTTAAADGAGVLRGVVVSRALISQAFGVSEAEVVEVCFALGTDEVKRVSPQPPRSSASDVVTWFVSQRPTPRFTSPDAGHALAITHARRRYDLDAALVPGFLDEYEDSDSDGEMFQDEASLAAFALKAAKVSEKHRNAILRFVCGERFTAVARSLPTPADRDAAYLYERACRDGIRRQKAWHLEPAKLFDAPTFYDMVGTAATILTGPTGDAGPAVDVLQRAASPLLSVEASAWQPLAVEASTWAPRLSAVEWSPAAHVEAHFEDSETSDDAAEAMTTSQSYGSLAHSQTALSPEQSAWDAAAQEAALDEFEFDEQPCGLEGLDASATAWAPVSTGWAPDACATAWAPATAKASSPTNSTSKSTYVQSLEAHVRQLESLLASRGMPFPSGPAPPRIYADDADADADLEDGLEDVLDEAFGESASQANPPAAGYPACGYPVLTPYVPGRAFPGSSALGAAYGSMATTLIGVPAFSSTFEVVDEDDHVVVVPALGEPSVEYATEPAIVQCADLPELPIDRARKAIVDRILQAQCTIVRGETGSGKSTRLPRFILEDMPGAKVVVAQPRRLAALQLYERAKADGVAVGVRVGMAGLASGEGDEVERGDPSRVRLWYMTSGVCAKLLCYNPSFFDDVTHLCVDEVHERDVDTDVVLALARRRLESLRQPRVVLLSATLDARLLVAYFRTDKPIDVEGRRFVLRRHALDVLGKRGDAALAGAWMPPRVSAARDELMRLTCKVQGPSTAAVSRSVVTAQLEVATWIARALGAGTAGGFRARAVLIFVAGMAEIAELAERFDRFDGDDATTRYDLVAVHSELPFEAQRSALFSAKQDEGFQRVVKIIVATNAAESSLTLPDVDAVVDCCSRKEPTYERETDRVVLRHVWSSKATAQQRAGRTGRVGPGVAYHLAARKLLDAVQDHDTPHVQAHPLDQVVLGLRSSLPELHTFLLLADFPTPPDEDHVADALVMLARRRLIVDDGSCPKTDETTARDIIRALDTAPLTPAGSLAAALPVDLRLSRLVMLGGACGALGDAVVLAAALSQPQPPWTSPLPLPQLYADSSDYLVAARQALLGRRRFDERRFSEPLALLAAVKAYRASPAGDQYALCATYALSAPRMKQLDQYATALKRRVAGHFPNQSLKRPVAGHFPNQGKTPEATSTNLLRLLVAWAFWDQCAILEPVSSQVSSLVSSQVSSQAQKSQSETRNKTCRLKLGVASASGGPQSLARPQLAPLFPPLVRWRLRCRRQLRAVNVAEVRGSECANAASQDALLRRVLNFAATLGDGKAGCEFVYARFAESRAVLAERFPDSTSASKWRVRFDGAAPHASTALHARLESMIPPAPRCCRVSTGCGWVSVELGDDVAPSDLRTLFGDGAHWTSGGGCASAASSAAIGRSSGVVSGIDLEIDHDDLDGECDAATVKHEPPPNTWTLGVQLVASAVLSSSARTKSLRVPASMARDSALERARAIDVKVHGPASKRAPWRLHRRLVGVDGTASLASHSLEQVYRPLVSSSRDASYAVAASLRLARARGADDGEGSPRSPGSGGGQGEGRDSKSGDEFVARLEGVTILPSADWFALALVCGGLRTARSVGVDVPHTVHFQLLDEAERVGAEMRNLIESGGALTRAADDGKQLGQRIEALFQRLPNKRPAPVDAADDEEDDAAPLGDATPPPADWEAPAEVPAPPVPAPPVALPDDELALAVAEFKRPLRGDVVSTRWGEARVERAGADRLVLRLTNWRATAYLQPSEILHIVQRRGGIASVDPVAEHNGRASPPTGRASPATGKTSPLGGRASPLTGRIESLNGRVSPRGRNSTTCSPPVKLDVVAATQPPRAPAFADLAPPLGAVLKPTVQQQDDAAGREDRKRWILDRKAAVEVPHFALMAPMQQPSTAMPSLAVAESKRDAATRRVRELFHLEPKAWVVAPGKVVSSARRWLGDGDAELLCVFVLDAVVAANGVEVLWDRRATELLGCIAELGPANLISGLARTSESQPKLLSRFAFLLKNLYDADMLDEDTILRWHGSPGNAGAKFAALPLVTWLKEAEEEEDDA